MIELDKLKELRLKKGYTQMYMARECGVNINSYIRWENGGAKPTLENQEKLEKILKQERKFKI